MTPTEIRAMHKANFESELKTMPDNVQFNNSITEGNLTLWHGSNIVDVKYYYSRTKKIIIVKQWMKLYPNFSKAYVTDSR